MASILYKGKQETTGGGGVFTTKEILQSRSLVYWNGDSTSSYSGFPMLAGVNGGGAVGSIGTGKVGDRSLIFNNTNTLMSLRLNELFVSAPRFSIFCWVLFAELPLGNDGGPWASWSSASISQMLCYRNNDRMRFVARLNSTEYNVFGSVGEITVNNWLSVLCEVDRFNNKIRMWINNVLRGETDIPAGASLNNATESFSLGGYQTNNNTYSNMIGRIDEFAIFSGNTNQDERDWLWNSGTGNSLA